MAEDMKFEKLKGRVKFPEGEADARYWVLGTDGEPWFEVRTKLATVDDVVMMTTLEPEQKPFIVTDNNLYRIKAGRLDVFVPTPDMMKGDTRLRPGTRKKLHLAAMTNSPMSKYGVAETPETREFYANARAAVEDMLRRGIQPEIPTDATEMLP